MWLHFFFHRDTNESCYEYNTFVQVYLGQYFFFLMYCRYCEDWLMWKKLPSMYTTSFQSRYDVERYRTTSYRRWNDVMCVLGMVKIFQNSKDIHDLERKWKWRYWAIISHWFECFFPELKRCRFSFYVIEIYLHSRRA